MISGIIPIIISDYPGFVLGEFTFIVDNLLDPVTCHIL